VRRTVATGLTSPALASLLRTETGTGGANTSGPAFAYANRDCLSSEIDGMRVLGDAEDRVSVLSLVVEVKQPSDIGKTLDADGIAVRPGKLEAESTLKKLDVDEAVRASFMFYNTREEADALAASPTRITAK
jgi:hypothetical protein